MWLEHLTRRGSAVAQFAHHVFFLAAGAYLVPISQACQLFIKQFKAVHPANLVEVPENSSTICLRSVYKTAAHQVEIICRAILPTTYSYLVHIWSIFYLYLMTVIRLQEGSTNSLQKQFSSFCRLLFLHAWVEINSYFWVRCGNTACWSAFHDSFFDPYLMTSILGWLQAGPLDQTMTQSGLMAGYACVFVQPITSHGRRPCHAMPYNTTFYNLMA